jgi:hypothetical protein
VDRLTVQKPAAEADTQEMRDRWRDQLLYAHSSIGVLEGDTQRLERRLVHFDARYLLVALRVAAQRIEGVRIRKKHPREKLLCADPEVLDAGLSRARSIGLGIDIGVTDSGCGVPKLYSEKPRMADHVNLVRRGSWILGLKSLLGIDMGEDACFRPAIWSISLGCQSWLEVPLSRRRAEGRAKAK